MILAISFEYYEGLIKTLDLKTSQQHKDIQPTLVLVSDTDRNQTFRDHIWEGIGIPK